MDDQPGPARRRSRRIDDDSWLMTIADIPLGHFVFVLVALGGLGGVFAGSLTADAYLTAIGGGSGLLVVGHGIRTRRR